MVIRAHFDHPLKQLRFEDFSITSFNYREEDPHSPETFVRFQAADKETEKVLTVFVKMIELQKAGFSLTTWRKIQNQNAPEKLSKLIQNTSRIDCLLKKAILIASGQLTFQYLEFFREIPFANRIIINAIYRKIRHLSKERGAPGIYFSQGKSSNIFINLKKTKPLGTGAYAKIRKALWLTAPEESSMLVAKKVPKDNDQDNSLSFTTEIRALQVFHGKRGIISMIAGGFYDDKYAIFLPIYECNLFTYFHKPPFHLTLDEELSMISQWLEGLATISEKGVHGDLSFKNLLLRKEEREVKAVICDFGTFCSYGYEEYGLTTPLFAPPEYFEKKIVSSKHDVWSMGISLSALFLTCRLPFWGFLKSKIALEERMARWTSTLTPSWILNYPTRVETPGFLWHLINQMLDPRPEHRPPAKEVFEHFSMGLASFNRMRSGLATNFEDILI